MSAGLRSGNFESDMTLNLNVGLLGHVDSGKTSLAKALSEIASTAAFDKDPQSQSRGITLDLGFSSFVLPIPEHLKTKCDYEKLQFTLVDCPGHASLIKTIIGGAHIIDMMLLVIDITKGVQTQTAECLVIGEIMCKRMIIVLNKIDLLEELKREKIIEKVKKKLENTILTTGFGKVSMVAVSVNPATDRKLGLENLVDEISKTSFLPNRQENGPFIFAVDHCFPIKGKGTVMTGTVLQGNVSVNDVIDIPNLNATRKIKSMQMFKKDIEKASQGDRLGICVTQFDSKLLERGIVCAPSLANFIVCAVISVNRIKYFQSPVRSKSKFHITIGYETAMGTVTIFQTQRGNTIANTFDINAEYSYVEELGDVNSVISDIYMVLEFEKPVLVVDNCKIIGSKFDTDVNIKTCRLAFHGTLLLQSKDKDYRKSFLSKLKIHKSKSKIGVVDRLIDDNSVIVKNMFKKESNINVFVNLKVEFCTGEIGVIESSFGQTGKIKILISDGLKETTLKCLQKNKHVSDTDDKSSHDPIQVILNFKRYVFHSKTLVFQ